MRSLQEAWSRKERRHRLTNGHTTAALINSICGVILSIFGEKFEPVSAEDIFPDPEEVEEIEQPQQVSALSASTLAHFKAEEIKHNERQIKEALARSARSKKNA